MQDKGTGCQSAPLMSIDERYRLPVILWYIQAPAPLARDCRSSSPGREQPSGAAGPLGPSSFLWAGRSLCHLWREQTLATTSRLLCASLRCGAPQHRGSPLCPQRGAQLASHPLNRRRPPRVQTWPPCTVPLRCLRGTRSHAHFHELADELRQIPRCGVSSDPSAPQGTTDHWRL